MLNLGWDSRQKWCGTSPGDVNFFHWVSYMLFGLLDVYSDTGSGVSLLGGASRHRLVFQDTESNGLLAWVQIPLSATVSRRR